MKSTARSPWPARGLSLAMLAAALGASAQACSSSGPVPPDGTHAGPGGPPVPPGPPVKHAATSSSTIAISEDDTELWVVNPDADSVSVIDTKSRSLIAEIQLAAAPPKVDPATKRFEPAVAPRALAIAGDKVYVAGQAAARVFVIDAKARAVRGSILVPTAPTGVVASPDGSAVYVVSHEAAQVTKIDPVTDKVTGAAEVSEHPWGAAVSEDGRSLYVTHLLLDPGVTVLDAGSLEPSGKVPFADQARPTPFDKRIPNGQARGAYTIVARPESGELWVPHLLLAVGTPQPDLDFESTVFPTISTVTAGDAAAGRRLLFQPPVPGQKGSFTDSVSGPRAVAFTPDGKLALVALGQSEDVMVFDAESGHEVGLVRPLPSTMLEGIVVDHQGTRAYVDGRNTHDVTVLSIDPSRSLGKVMVDGAPIDRLESDPMPAELRKGQRLFYTANSAAFPITKNFWVACASCHIEGGSDAVTWLFSSGPRDTPSNAGGPINTGFLMRQATRTDLSHYDETINVEQGGNYDRNKPAQKGDLDAIAAFVNYAIPLPPNPYLAADGALTESQKRGQATFGDKCASCHGGPFLTDSAEGNPGLDLSKEVVLHDVGTCVTNGKFPDQKNKDVTGNPRTACDFDTPTLRGIFASAPYFHDGSARTLKDVVDRLSYSAELSEEEKADLVAYMQTL